MDNIFQGKNVVITGGVGSVGREIVRQLQALGPAEIRAVDNNESGLFDFEHSIEARVPTTFYHCDITDEYEMRRVLSGMDFCFHAAALKHVPSCERSPFSAVNTNIRGSEIVIRAALFNHLQRVLFTSSDKAVNPTNVMGTSKLMGERLFTAANDLHFGGKTGTIFTSTRFGNVLGSRGSVIPLFIDQIRKGGPVKLTDRRMTRFVMTIEEATRLVIESMGLATGGEVFITKMPVLRIEDLAHVLIEQFAPTFGHDPARIEVIEIGSRPGEKLWEELSTDEESRRLLEGDRYMSVMPALAPMRDSAYEDTVAPMKRSERIYHSAEEQPMSRDEIGAFLRDSGLLAAA